MNFKMASGNALKDLLAARQGHVGVTERNKQDRRDNRLFIEAAL